MLQGGRSQGSDSDSAGSEGTADKATSLVHSKKRQANGNSKQSAGGKTRTPDSQQQLKEPNYVRNSVFTFTHDDVINERVSFVSRRVSEMSSEPRQETIAFVLTARNAQPAAGFLSVDVQPPILPSSLPLHPVLRLSSARDGENPSATELAAVVTPVGQSGWNWVHLLVILLMSTLTLMLTIALVAVRCYMVQQRRKRYLAAVERAQNHNALLDDDTTSHRPGRPLGRPRPGWGPDLPRGRQPLACDPSLVLTISSSSNENDSCNSGGNLVQTSARPFLSKNGGHFGNLRPSAYVICRKPDGGLPTEVSVDSNLGVRTDFENADEDDTEPVSLDWRNVDPEIVQHCRKTNPLLQSERVWV